MTGYYITDEALFTAIRNALVVAHVQGQALTDLEREALGYAAEEAGAYLVQIGKTDFAEMEPEERDAFAEKLILGYRHALRRAVNNLPPF